MGKTFNDERFEFYCTALGLPYNTNKTSDDLEYEWLAAQVDKYTTLTGSETNRDLWHLFLEAIGYGSSYGTIQDRQMAWLEGDFGYTTGTWNDRMHRYYTEWEVEGWLLTDVEANQFKDVDGNFILVLATS
jgi:hypothetical protein